MSATADEARLVARSARGDREAFGALVRTYQTVAVRLAAYLAGRDSAEDVVQEAFVKAFRRLDGFDPGRPFRPWLLAIVANEARDDRRRGLRRDQLVLRAAAPRSNPPEDPAELALAALGAGRLAEAIAALEPSARTAVVLRHVLDLSEEETATVLGVPAGTVKSRTSRALARLREQLEREVAAT